MIYAKAKNLGPIVIAVLLFSMIIQTAKTQTVNSSAPDKALTLITEVLQLDKTRYTASLTLYNKPSAGSAYDVSEEYVAYNLVNNDGVTAVRCTFRNNRLFTLMATAPPNAELIYAQPFDNILDLTMGIMERYQIFLEDNSLSEMINVLDTVDSVANATMNAGNMKLEITTDSYGTSFYWKHVYNNCEYDEVSIVFQQTRRILIGDMQSRYKMGSTETKIPKEQALEIAIKYVESYSYEAIGGTGENETRVTVGNFNISRERTTAELYPAERDGLLYSCWRVSVALASVYPGNVYGFSVDVWADSGEVSYLGTLAVGGDPTGTLPDEDSTIDPSPQQNNNVFAIDTGFGIAVVASIVIAVLVSAGLLVYFKKRKR